MLREWYRSNVYFDVQIKCVVKRRIATIVVDSARNARFTGRMEWKMWQQSPRIGELRTSRVCSVSIKNILHHIEICVRSTFISFMSHELYFHQIYRKPNALNYLIASQQTKIQLYTIRNGFISLYFLFRIRNIKWLIDYHFINTVTEANDTFHCPHDTTNHNTQTSTEIIRLISFRFLCQK